MKRIMYFFALMAVISLGAYQAQAQEQQAAVENKSILSGVIWLDSKCVGETCTVMQFDFFVTSDGMASLAFFNYRTVDTYPEGTQVPLESAKELQKILLKLYPKATMQSDGRAVIFSLFEQKKNINLLDQGVATMDNIAKSKPKFKVDINHYASQ